MCSAHSQQYSQQCNTEQYKTDYAQRKSTATILEREAAIEMLDTHRQYSEKCDVQLVFSNEESDLALAPSW